MVATRVFAQLVDDVLSGRYEPGEKLPTQRTLAADLGVNMAPVREAVKRLEQLGLVEVRQGDAMRVTDWRTSGGLDVVAHVLFAAGGLDRDTLADLLEARRLMLTESARLAAEHRDAGQAERLLQLARRFADSEGPSAQAIDWQFFHELVEAAGNVVLVLVMNSIRRIYFDRSELFAAVVADRTSLSPLYVRAARAIERGQQEAAARAIRELTLMQERALMGSLA